MYRYGDLIITSLQVRERLFQEGRRTDPCPFCKSIFISPINIGSVFAMECLSCGCTGPSVGDYTDPNGLSDTSWVFALKRCHDKWNGRNK